MNKGYNRLPEVQEILVTWTSVLLVISYYLIHCMRNFPCLSWFSVLRSSTQIQLLANPSKVWAGYWWTCSYAVTFSQKCNILATYLNFDAEIKYGCQNTIGGEYCRHGMRWEYIGKMCFKMHRNNCFFSEVINSTILRMQDRNVHSNM